MEKKKESSSIRKENKDNKQASVLSKLDHGPSGRMGAKHAGSHVLLDYIIEIISFEFNFLFREV